MRFLWTLLDQATWSPIPYRTTPLIPCLPVSSVLYLTLTWKACPSISLIGWTLLTLLVRRQILPSRSPPLAPQKILLLAGLILQLLLKRSWILCVRSSQSRKLPRLLLLLCPSTLRPVPLARQAVVLEISLLRTPWLALQVLLALLALLAQLLLVL